MSIRAGTPGTTLTAGVEFLGSIQNVLHEAEEQDFTSITEFRKLTSSILKFLMACRKMTGARARASCPICLPDGRHVITHVALPPTALNLNRETTKRLREAHSSNEFYGILLSQIHEQLHAKRSDLGKAGKNMATPTVSRKPDREKKRPSKRSPEPTPSPPSAKKACRRRRTGQTLPRSGKNNHNIGVGGTAVSGDGTVAPASVTGRVNAVGSKHAEKTGKVRDSQEKKSSMQAPCPAQSSAGPAKAEMVAAMPAKPSKIRVLNRKRKMEQQPAKQQLPLQQEQQETPPPKVISQEDDLHSDTSSDERETVSDVSELSDIVPPVGTGPLEKLAQENNKQRGLQMARKDQSTQQTHQEPEQSAATTRFLRMIPHISDGISSVSSKNWDRYLRRIRSYANSEGIREADFKQRLMKLVEIVYLSEELDAIAAKEWDRLLRIAELCSVIAEVLGPESEVVDYETRDQWTKTKNEDINSLKKLFENTNFKASLECE